MPRTHNDVTYFTSTEVASLLGKTSRTIRRMNRRGEFKDTIPIHVTSPDRGVLISESDLRLQLDKIRTQATTLEGAAVAMKDQAGQQLELVTRAEKWLNELRYLTLE